MRRIAGNEDPALTISFHFSFIYAKRGQPDRAGKTHRSPDAAINDCLDLFYRWVDSRPAGRRPKVGDVR